MNDKKLLGVDTFLAKIFLVLLLTSAMFNNSYLVLPNEITSSITFLLFFIYLIVSVLKNYNIKRFIEHILVLCVAMISYIATGASLFAYILLSLNVLDVLTIKKILKYFIVVKIISLLIIIFASIFGIINNDFVITVKSGTQWVGRYALGYEHPNQLAQSLGSLLLAIYCYRFNNKVPNLNLIIFLFSSIIIYLLTASRTFLILSILFFLLNFLLSINTGKGEYTLGKHILKHHLFYVLFMLFFCLGASYLLTRVSGSLQTILYALNQKVSSRLSFSSAVIQNYDLTLFGTTFDFSLLEPIFGKYAVDMSYINLIYGFGLIPAISFFIMIELAMSNLYKNNMMVLLIYTYILLLWGVFENIFTNLSVNFILILFARLLFSSDNKNSV